jgi:succinate-acetate transporter protein
MEAGSVPAREADLAPAAEAAGWTPADPAPLGLAAFAATTFVLSIFNAGLVRITGTAIVLGLALAYGGIAQLLAGMWEFRRNNVFGAVAFTSYGAFWISFFVILRVTPVTALSGASVSVYLYAWTIFTLLMFVGSLRTNAVVALVFLLLTITFLFLAIGNAALGPKDITNSTIKLGGWLGLATAIVAWYGSFAIVVNTQFDRTLLPVWPLGG